MRVGKTDAGACLTVLGSTLTITTPSSVGMQALLPQFRPRRPQVVRNREHARIPRALGCCVLSSLPVVTIDGEATYLCRTNGRIVQTVDLHRHGLDTNVVGGKHSCMIRQVGPPRRQPQYYSITIPIARYVTPSRPPPLAAVASTLWLSEAIPIQAMPNVVQRSPPAELPSAPRSGRAQRRACHAIRS